ncbi:hypothetical protein [Pseudobacteriovorax antillogorgiicola]|nr:hypothetical protein [Pseudobacteriovorax antillogorgiicola]
MSDHGAIQFAILDGIIRKNKQKALAAAFFPFPKVRHLDFP